MASSPRILRHRPPKLCKKPVSQVIIAPRAQASRRCETQATLGGKPPPLLPFRSLDPFRALREPDRRRRDEERLSRSEQRTGKNQKRLLDRKSPIQVRIHLPPAASPLRTRLPSISAPLGTNPSPSPAFLMALRCTPSRWIPKPPRLKSSATQDSETERLEPGSLPHRHPFPDRRRASDQPHLRTDALGLPVSHQRGRWLITAKTGRLRRDRDTVSLKRWRARANAGKGHAREPAHCQTASKRDPGSASKRAPSPALGPACPGSEQEGPA